MAKVYFTDMSVNGSMNMLQKLDRLLDRLELKTIISKDSLVAVKLHFGEYGNLAFIRPQYLRIIVDHLKDLGAKPFLTDANTLYKGHRSNAVDHLWNAFMNGFTPEVVGAPVVIADGLRGADQIEIQIDGQFVKRAKIGSAVALADVIVSVTHFKGHMASGFGGTIKNLGMGSASRAGKLEQHSETKPKVNVENCVACKMCQRFCPTGAITVQRYAIINYDLCVGCGECVAMCNYGAMEPSWDASNEILCKKMVEYTKAVLKDKKAVFVAFLMDISPDCDCWNANKQPVSPNIGIAASYDPVALEQACIDLVIKTVGKDPFKEIHPKAPWEVQIEYAEQVGLGSRQYELVKIACDLR